MANRLVDTVLIVDSATGNVAPIQASSGNLTKYYISAVAFWYGTSSATFALSGANTNDVIVKFGPLQSLSPSVEMVHFTTPLHLSTLKVPVCSAGTGFIYLS